MAKETYRKCRRCGLEWYEVQISFKCPHCGRKLQDTDTILLRKIKKAQEGGGGD